MVGDVITFFLNYAADLAYYLLAWYFSSQSASQSVVHAVDNGRTNSRHVNRSSNIRTSVKIFGFEFVFCPFDIQF